MDFTFELAKTFGVLPFVILEQDKDTVIMAINYLIEKGENATQENSENHAHTKTTKDKQQRIRVNDATATGGWF